MEGLVASDSGRGKQAFAPQEVAGSRNGGVYGLRSSPFCASVGLPMPAIEDLAVHVDAIDIPAGEVIVRQGDSSDDRFYVIRTGNADAIADGSVIETMGPGEGFGEIALLRETLRTATVRARTRLELLTLDRRQFLRAVTGYPSSNCEGNGLVRAPSAPSTLEKPSPHSAPSTEFCARLWCREAGLSPRRGVASFLPAPILGGTFRL
jgi:Cyclic nucleotide-binding domain